MNLLRIRSFRVAVSGNLLTRLGIGGLPFLLPLLYQVGLGFTPIQSGLMIMPQALAAISFKFTLPVILKRFGYRQVLIANTVMLGVMLMLFSTIDVGTPAWLIALQAFAYGFFTSTQYTSMNTLAYADVNQRAGERRQHHREHGPANGRELRRRGGLAHGRFVHSGPHACQRAGNDPWPTPRAAAARCDGRSCQRSCSAN